MTSVENFLPQIARLWRILTTRAPFRHLAENTKILELS